MTDNKVKYKLVQPSEQTIKRMLEIEFYLSFYHLYYMTYGRTWELATNFITSMAKLCDVDHWTLIGTFSELNKIYAKPSKMEIIITLRYYGIPYKQIYSIYGIHPDTVRTYLKKYVEKEQPPLKPKLSPELYEAVLTALEVISRTITPLVTSSMIINIGRDVRNKWTHEDAGKNEI